MQVLTTVEVFRDRIDALAQPGGALNTHWFRLMVRIDAAAKRNLSGKMVNVRTGNLRSSQSPPVVLVVGGNLVGISENTASYAAAVHDGTRAHEIRPSRAQVLRFTPAQAGGPIFRPAVMHPGTKARPFLRDAMIEVMASGV